MRGDRDPRCGGTVAGPDEPRTDRDQNADGECDPAGGGERLRDDLPRIVRRGPNRVARDDVIDEVPPGEPPRENHEHADSDQAETERANLLAAPSAGQPDCADPARDGEDPDEVRDLLEPVRDLLGRLQVIGLEDRHLPRVLRDLVREIADETEPVA